MTVKGRTRDQRVTLALKYHHLDGLTAAEIKERFEQEGVGEYARSTILDYLNDSPKEEVIEQIDKEQAHVREQIADRQERLFKRARDAEFDAFDRDEVVAMVPKFETNDTKEERMVPAWESVPEDEYPPEATRFDKRVRFTGKSTFVDPGEAYPIKGPDGEPIYEPAVVAVRKIEDSKERSFLRREQADHLEAKGEALGVYEENINLSGDLGIETTKTLGDEEKDLARELIRQQQRKESGGPDE